MNYLLTHLKPQKHVVKTLIAYGSDMNEKNATKNASKNQPKDPKI